MQNENFVRHSCTFLFDILFYFAEKIRYYTIWFEWTCVLRFLRFWDFLKQKKEKMVERIRKILK